MIKLQLGATKCQEERAKLMNERRKHMLQQLSCRNVYYGWRLFSELYPQKYLCIIHDKMDQQKTAIPRLKVKSKDTDRACQLPVSLTGVITHGHGQGRYGHFAIGLWPSDPNFTIGSLSLCLRNLERIDNHLFGDLVEDGMSNLDCELLESLTSRKSLDLHNMMDNKDRNYLHSIGGDIIEHSSNLPIFKCLPENLMLQLDNCGSENKNRFLFAYLSLLVARGTFKMIQLGFLMVGHTHEDIDAMFSKFSEKLRTSQTFTFPHLMDTFNTCETSSPTPFLITKVPDFKAFLEGYLCEGQEALVGHSKPLQFRFYMQENIPIMQYKMHPKSNSWLPTEGGIELWKRDSKGSPMLPTGVPRLVPMFEYVKDNLQVSTGINDYIKHWKYWVGQKGPMSPFTQYISPVIEYWEKMLTCLNHSNVGKEGEYYVDFWPQTRRIEGFQNVVEHDDDEFLGVEELDGHYCGPQRGKPKDVFSPIVDVRRGDFVLVRPSDTIYPIWLGMAQTDVDTNKQSLNHKKILLQYWAPMTKKKNATDVEVYENCWNKQWMCNKKDPMRWEAIDSIVWAWGLKGQKPPQKVKIPKSAYEKALENLKEATKE